jgi:hypothetical protein
MHLAASFLGRRHTPAGASQQRTPTELAMYALLAPEHRGSPNVLATMQPTDGLMLCSIQQVAGSVYWGLRELVRAPAAKEATWADAMHKPMASSTVLVWPCALTVSAGMPHSLDVITADLSAATPRSWPTKAGSPCRVAHLLLPSMIICKAPHTWYTRRFEFCGAYAVRVQIQTRAFVWACWHMEDAVA